MAAANDANARAEALRDELAYHEHRYHVLDYPLIASRRYRAMRKELAQLERDGVKVTHDSASLRDGAPPRESFVRVQHKPPWPDYPGVRSPAELRRYTDSLTELEGGRPPVCVGSAWMTGVEVVLTYEDGLLRRAVLKGDGRQGEDVTDNIRTLGSVPLRLRPPGSITESRVSRLTREGAGPSTATPVPAFPEQMMVRGIVSMRSVDLLALERRRIDAGEAPYVQPLAAIASSLVRLDSRLTASRRLKLFAVDTVETPTGIETTWQLLGALKSWGFNVTSLIWRCVGYEEILDFVNALQQEKARFEYPLDGGLLRANRLFFTNDGNGTPVPRQVYLTFTSAGKKARVVTVYRAVGRTGAVLPVALIQREGGPATPDGVPLPARTSTEMLDVREGATVRALPGGIAPVLEVEGGAPAEPAPDAGLCPACRGPLRCPPDEPFAFCDNLACRGRARSRLLHLIGPRGLALKSLNARIAESIFQGRAVGLPDLYSLDPEALEAAAPGAGEAFRGEIERARRLPLWKLLYLSSIPYVGERFARLIASSVFDVSGLFSAPPEAVASRIALTPDAASGLVLWLKTDAHAIIDRLKALGVDIVGEEESFAAPFAGKRLVVGGKLDALSHERVIDEIERRGGTLDSRVSRKTDLLVTGRESADATAAAEAYRVTQVNEEELLGVLRMTST